jgi:RNA polymerase sigma factor (TIGR02999 family)
MNEVMRVLSAIEQGDPLAPEQLLPLVYDELRQLAAARLAQERPGQTLDATALVHEAYLRLVAGTADPLWSNRGHFFAACAEAMRRILVENARRKGRQKRGGDRQRQDLLANEPAIGGPEVDILDVHEALDELAAEHPEKAELVKLRYFAGLTLPEAAAVLQVSTATAERHWRYARAWLARRLRDDPDEQNPEHNS